MTDKELMLRFIDAWRTADCISQETIAVQLFAILGRDDREMMLRILERLTEDGKD